MNKKACIVMIGVLFGAFVLCGCQASQVDTHQYDDIFHSSVVRLVNYTLNLERDHQTSIIVKASVNGRITNLKDQMMNVIISTSFYDKQNKLLGEKSYTILGLRAKGAPGSTTTFDITYDDKDTVAYVDHVTFLAMEE